MGPVSQTDLELLLKGGRLPAETAVSTKGQDEWTRAAEAKLIPERSDAEEETPSPLPVAPEKIEARKDCPGCGVENREKAKFCRGCGHSLAEVAVVVREAKVACPSCEVPVDPEAKFCRSCGTRLK